MVLDTDNRIELADFRRNHPDPKLLVRTSSGHNRCSFSHSLHTCTDAGDNLPFIVATISGSSREEQVYYHSLVSSGSKESAWLDECTLEAFS